MQAAALGLDEDLIAAILLTWWLSGPLGHSLTDQAQLALASLQERTREATETLERSSVDGSPERLAPFQELLEQIEETERRSGRPRAAFP